MSGIVLRLNAGLCVPIQSRITPPVQWHLVVVLKSCNHIIVRAERPDLSILVRVSSEDLLEISLFGLSFLLLLREVVVLGKLIVIKFFLYDLALHLDQLIVHGDCVHATYDWLARRPVESDAIVRPVLVLVVKERPLGHVDLHCRGVRSAVRLRLLLFHLVPSLLLLEVLLLLSELI